MAKQKDTTLSSTDKSLNEQQPTSSNGIMERPFDQQFSQKFDWRFLKNIETVVHQQMLTVEDVDDVSGTSYRLVGDGVFYNAHFPFSILEMGVSWNGVPAGNVLFQVLNVPCGTDVSAGTPIPFTFAPKDLGTSPAAPFVEATILTIPSFAGAGVPVEDCTNMYNPVQDIETYSFDRFDRIAISLLSPPIDIKDISPITFTFRIRHQKL